jgi:16S rRNA (guanine527-N7)-methyltransferase
MTRSTSLLEDVLVEARDLGFLGPGPVGPHIEHARGFAVAYGDPRGPALALDLGSGAGLPGLVLALGWPQAELVLLDAGERRTAFLEQAVADLGIADRVRVVRGRAEEVGRHHTERGRYDLVVARSFAAPPVVAECAAPFLRVGGRLITSEPPERSPATGERWPADGLGLLGLSPSRRVENDFSYRVAEQQIACPDRFPRRVGVPAKRPLF